MALEIERKFLVEKLDGDMLAMLGARPMEIEQYYLMPSLDFPVRRIRRVRDGAGERYFYTEKRPASGGFSREELEYEISQNQYLELQKERDYSLNVISKTRYVLPQGDLTLELDAFPFFPCFDVLEIELPREDYPYIIPSFIKVIKEVTTDYRFANVALAKEIPSL